MHWYSVEYKVLGRAGLNDFDCQAHDRRHAEEQFEVWAAKEFGTIETSIERTIFIDMVADDDWFSHDIDEPEWYDDEEEVEDW